MPIVSEETGKVDGGKVTKVPGGNGSSVSSASSTSTSGGTTDSGGSSDSGGNIPSRGNTSGVGSSSGHGQGDGDDPDRRGSELGGGEDVFDPKEDSEEENEEEENLEDPVDPEEQAAAAELNETEGSIAPSSAPGSPAQGDGFALGAANVEGKQEWLSYKDLMSSTYPVKSRKLYLAAYVTLENYLKRGGKYDPDTAPDQLSLLNYFRHLRVDKGWGASTLWSHFSRVNAVMKRTWGVNLTIYPRISDMLKGYESGQRVKKASVFSPQQGCVITIVIFTLDVCRLC